MNNYIVTFQIKSSYEIDTFDKTVVSTKAYEAENLDGLFEILDDPDEIDQIDDHESISVETDDQPYEINVEYVLINDSDGKELYRDEDYN